MVRAEGDVFICELNSCVGRLVFPKSLYHTQAYLEIMSSSGVYGDHIFAPAESIVIRGIPALQELNRVLSNHLPLDEKEGGNEIDES